MDAVNKRKVTTVDIPAVFLQEYWPQDEHPRYIMFEWIMVDMICEINSLFHPGVKTLKRNSHTVDLSKQSTGRYFLQSSSITSYPNIWLIMDLHRTNKICVLDIKQ